MELEPTARLALYVEGQFGKGSSKVAEGILRYSSNPVVCVIDSTCAGRLISKVSAVNHPAPIVASLQDAIALGGEVLVLGATYAGSGGFPQSWRREIMAAIEAGMSIVNGLHDLLCEDEEIVSSARRKGVRLFDVRVAPSDLPIGSAQALNVAPSVILTVGTDAYIGKMTTSLELERECKRRGLRSKFIATGQTGIMLSGEGICIDRAIGDFMAGAVEKMVVEAGNQYDFLFVEGQGGIAHPGFSGVTLALLHGACPRGMVLCHDATRQTMRKLPFPLPSLDTAISAYESMSNLVSPCKVLAISVNTSAVDSGEARGAIAAIEAETGLPCDDPVRFGCERLFDAVLAVKGANRETRAPLPGNA